jgi:hypothetical protein
MVNDRGTERTQFPMAILKHKKIEFRILKVKVG